MGMVKENHDKLFKAKLKINVVQTYGQLFFFNNNANTIHLDKKKVLECMGIFVKSKTRINPYIILCTITNMK